MFNSQRCYDILCHNLRTIQKFLRGMALDKIISGLCYGLLGLLFFFNWGKMVYNILFVSDINHKAINLWTHYKAITIISLVTIHHHIIDPLHSFPQLFYPFQSGNCPSVLCIYKFCAVCLLCFYMPYISEIVWFISFSIIPFGLL